jgi:hypothetical protein
MIRSTVLFFPPGGDVIIGMVTKTFTDVSVDEARDLMIKDVDAYRQSGPLMGADMTVQAAEVSDHCFENDGEAPVFTRKSM